VKPEEQPSVIRIINVLEFITLNNFEQQFLSPFPTVEESTL
jgi:hypothetical protein